MLWISEVKYAFQLRQEEPVIDYGLTCLFQNILLVETPRILVGFVLVLQLISMIIFSILLQCQYNSFQHLKFGLNSEFSSQTS
jgi:hypothetical protein